MERSQQDTILKLKQIHQEELDEVYNSHNSRKLKDGQTISRLMQEKKEMVSELENMKQQKQFLERQIEIIEKQYLQMKENNQAPENEGPSAMQVNMEERFRQLQEYYERIKKDYDVISNSFVFNFFSKEEI